MTRKVVAEKRI